MSQVYVHIGYAKAGSTALQAFFAAVPGLHCVDGGAACRMLVGPSPSFYDTDTARAFFARELARERTQDAPSVVSHERLSGNPHSGHYDAFAVASRLAALLPGARIGIVIREQTALVASIYKQYVRIGGTRTLAQYLESVWDLRLPLFDWRAYEFHRLVAHYRELFGVANVDVWLFESLSREPRKFFASLASRLGVAVPAGYEASRVHNPGITEAEVERTRVRNLFTPVGNSLREPSWMWQWLQRVALPVAATLAQERYAQDATVQDAVRAVVGGRYAASNAALSRMLDIDLRVYGYEVGA